MTKDEALANIEHRRAEALNALRAEVQSKLKSWDGKSSIELRAIDIVQDRGDRDIVVPTLIAELEDAHWTVIDSEPGGVKYVILNIR